MRLTPLQARIIRQTADRVLGRDAKVLLFGSRVDDSARGGDIDLYVEMPQPVTDGVALVSRFVAELQLKMGEQKIDVVMVDPDTDFQPIHQIAQKTGVQL
jgi:predicted nucleotidyltransferase